MFIFRKSLVFQSSSHARHPLLSAVAGDDQHVWSYVSLTVNRPWFFMVYTFHTVEGDISEQILLSAPEQVADLFRRNGKEISVSQLMLVSPGHFKQSEQWRMDPLAQIWRGKKAHSAFRYRLADGREYVEGIHLTARSAGEELTCLVSFDPSEIGVLRPSPEPESGASDSKNDDPLAVRFPH